MGALSRCRPDDMQGNPRTRHTTSVPSPGRHIRSLPFPQGAAARLAELEYLFPGDAPSARTGTLGTGAGARGGSGLMV